MATVTFLFSNRFKRSSDEETYPEYIIEDLVLLRYNLSDNSNSKTRLFVFISIYQQY